MSLESFIGFHHLVGWLATGRSHTSHAIGRSMVDNHWERINTFGMCFCKSFDHYVKTSFQRASSTTVKYFITRLISVRNLSGLEILYKLPGLDFYTKESNFQVRLFCNKQNLEAGVFEPVGTGHKHGREMTGQKSKTNTLSWTWKSSNSRGNRVVPFHCFSNEQSCLNKNCYFSWLTLALAN